MSGAKSQGWGFWGVAGILAILLSACSHGVVKPDEDFHGKEVLILSGKLEKGDVRVHALPGPGVSRKGESRPIADTITAVPLIQSKLSRQSLAESRTAVIKPDGRFSLRLAKDRNYVLVLLDSKAKGRGKFAGQVAFRVEASRWPLLVLPARDLKAEKLELGEIQTVDGLELCSRVLENTVWNLKPGQIEFLAENDGTFLNVKNLITNYDAGNGISYMLRPDFHWEGDYMGMKGEFCYPSRYTHYNFQLDSNSTELTMEKICGTGGETKVAVELFPPAGTSVVAKSPQVTYDANTPIANNLAAVFSTLDGFVEARDEDFFATNRYGDISYTFGAELLTDPVPGGFWQYKVGGAQRAQFDVGVTVPKTDDGMVNGLVPVLHANLDASGKIVSFNVRWFQRDESADIKYTEITDLSMLPALVESAGVFLENQASGMRRYESVSFNPVTQTVAVLSQDWYYGASGTAQTQAERVGTFYRSAGIGFFFEYPRVLYPEGDPECILPVPAGELGNVGKGQAYHPGLPNQHDGLDFGFVDWPATPGQYVLHDIVAPVSGTVSSINGHVISGKPNASNNYAYTMEFIYNENWGTFLCFEPDTQDQTIVDLQKEKFWVVPGQHVDQGQVVGQLVTSLKSSDEVFGSHVHWQLFRLETGSKPTVCPKAYCKPADAAALDTLYQSLGILDPCAEP